MNNTSPTRLAALLAAVYATFLAVPASAQEYWTNTTAGAYSLSTNTNWESGNTLTAAATDLRFFINSTPVDLTLSGVYTITNDLTGLALTRLDLDGQSTAAGNSVALGGNSLTLADGATLTLGNQASSGGNAFGYTISAPVTLAGGLAVTGSPANPGGITFSAVTLPGTAATYTVSSANRISLNNVTLAADHSFAGSGTGGITFGGTVTLAGNRVFNVTGNSTTTLGGTITDGDNSYSITKTGSGILGLGAANHSIDGGIIHQGGVLILNAGGGTFNHSPAGVTVQNGSTVRIEWTGTPSPLPVVATAVDYGATGGILDFGIGSGNPITVTHSGNITGSGPLRIIARNGKDSASFTGDNSAYSGALSIESANPTTILQTQAVYFGSATARFGSASAKILSVINGGRAGFSGAVAAADLANYAFGPRSGVLLSGAAGAFDSGITDPFAYAGAGGGIVLNNRDILNNSRWPDATAVALDNQSLLIIGRNSSNNLNNEAVGDLTYAGGSIVALDLQNSTNSGVKLTAASMASPSAGNSLQLTVNDSADQWGTTNGLSHIIVSGTKPTVTNGMVSPGIQYYSGGNSLGHFMTFSGDDLIKASYNSEFDSGSAVEIANVTVPTILAADEAAHAVRCSSIDLNLGGFTLYITGGGLMHGAGGKSISNGTIDFGSTPAFLGMYNAAAQTNITAKISGSGGVTVLGSGQSANLTNNNNNFTGGLFINGATVSLSTSAANGNPVTVNAFGRLTVNSGSTSATIGGLSGDGRVAAFFQGNSTTSGTLIIAPASGTRTFSGTFSNGDSGRVLSITKGGAASTQIFGADSVASHTGTTAVTAGTLLIDGDFSGAPGNVTVALDAALGGKGRIGGATTIADGGKLAFTLSTPAASHDKLEILSTLGFDGASELVLTVSGTAAAGTYTLVTAASPITGSAPATVTAPGGWSGTAYTDGKDLKLNLVATGASPFDTWASGYGLTGGDADETADPDGDAVDNVTEFALDGDPTDGGARGLLFAKLADIGAETDVLTLTIAARSGAVFTADGNNRKAVVAADSLTYVVSAADDLSAWGTAVVSEVTGGDAAAIQAGLPAPKSGWSYKTFRSDGYGSGDATDFIRVEVTSP